MKLSTKLKSDAEQNTHFGIAVKLQRSPKKEFSLSSDPITSSHGSMT